MSIYVAFSDEPGEQVASNQGWSDFGNWVETLSGEKFDQIIALWENGECYDIPALIHEIAAAVHLVPPHETVKATANALISALNENNEAEFVLITDGMTADNDSKAN